MSEIHRTADQDTLRTVLEICAELKAENERLRQRVAELESEYEMYGHAVAQICTESIFFDIEDEFNLRNQRRKEQTK